MSKRGAPQILLGLTMFSFVVAFFTGILKARASPPADITALYEYYVPFAHVHIPESYLPGRWPHNFGQLTLVTYRWGYHITGQWRTAFQQGILDWNNAPTLVTLSENVNSQNTLNSLYYRPDPPGYCLLYFDLSGNPQFAECYGNEYWDDEYGYNDTQRRSIAAHETGHLQLIGEIPDYYRVWEPLMSEVQTLAEMNLFYYPQGEDIRLVNIVYP